MHCHNRFDSLGVADPGFVSLSEGDPESSDQEMVEEQAALHGAMEVDCPFDYFVRNLNASTASVPPVGTSPSEAHSLDDLPLTLADSQPYGIYFFHSKMLKVLTQDGINPRRRVTGGKSSTLKVLPSAVQSNLLIHLPPRLY